MVARTMPPVSKRSSPTVTPIELGDLSEGRDVELGDLSEGREAKQEGMRLEPGESTRKRTRPETPTPPNSRPCQLVSSVLRPSWNFSRSGLSSTAPCQLKHRDWSWIQLLSHQQVWNSFVPQRRQNQTTAARRAQPHMGGSEYASSEHLGSRPLSKTIIHTPASIPRPHSIIPNMSPMAQTTPHVTEPSQATNPKPAVTPPSHKPKRSLGNDEGDNTGRKAAGKAQKDNNSSMMERGRSIDAGVWIIVLDNGRLPRCSELAHSD